MHRLLELPVTLTQLHKSSTFVFPGLWWNVGTWNVSSHAECLQTEERTCQHPCGVIREGCNSWGNCHSGHLTGLLSPCFASTSGHSPQSSRQIFLTPCIRSHHFLDYPFKDFSLKVDSQCLTKASISCPSLPLQGPLFTVPPPAPHS